MQRSRPNVSVVLLLCPTAASTQKDPCPPGAVSVPALTLPWELAAGHPALLFISTCLGQVGQVIKSSLPGTF